MEFSIFELGLIRNLDLNSQFHFWIKYDQKGVFLVLDWKVEHQHRIQHI